MPIESFLPVIDNRRFDDILAEVRTRIPRYSPEWTDFNDSDPGITLAQLFAWMTDLLLYRIGLVPELNYLKFLQLIGIELQPSQPASAEVTFPVKTSAPKTWVSVPAGTPVATESVGGDPPIVFETTRELVALKATIAAVQVLDGYSFFNVTSINEAGNQGYEPFGPAAAEGSALMIGFDLNDAFPEVEINIAIFAEEKQSPDTFTSCGGSLNLPLTTSTISWEYWSGSSWRTLTLLKDETDGFLKSGHVYLKAPAAGLMAKTTAGTVAATLYWIRARLTRAAFDRVPRILALRTNTVGVIQAQTSRDEVLGGSTGEPNQTFRLIHAPVLMDSLSLEVDEGTGFTVWKRVDDFFSSGPHDQVYVLNATNGEIRFGDGVHGAIPTANVDNAGSNVVARVYRSGGGKNGNVAAGAIKTPLVSVIGIDDGKISNLQPAVGGTDEQSIEDAKQRAASVLRSNGRAVTGSDFEELARQSGNVRRAKALPLYHPRFPGTKIPGVVTVIVVPDNDQPNPLPSEATIRLVCAYLNQRRLLTTELYVIPPSYVRIDTEVHLTVSPLADLAAVTEAAQDALTEYFHPLRGGEDGLGWPFGGTIFFSRVYQRLLSVPGVERVDSVAITVDGETAPDCTNIPIPAVTLLFSGVHQVVTAYDFSEDQ
ncbi:MAG TPA: putative baseplate assembly protein [Bryobacteraceae bacterium]|jgi:predicted phage baseplate assembly protein